MFYSYNRDSWNLVPIICLFVQMREVSRYRNRFDKLEERQVYCPESRVVEHFGRGREDKLAQVIIKPVWVVRKQVITLERGKFSNQRKEGLNIFSFYCLKASSNNISLQGVGRAWVWQLRKNQLVQKDPGPGLNCYLCVSIFTVEFTNRKPHTTKGFPKW